jgi:hypothetical protein
MRTTLTIDDDVAALLQRAMARTKKSLKEQVNEALRLGLCAEPALPRRKRHRTSTYDPGRCLIGSVTSTSEALAIAEGEAFR